MSTIYFLYRSSLIITTYLFILFNLLIMIKCEEKINHDIIDNNDLFLILSKDGFLRAFKTKEIKEQWNIFFGDNLIPKNINSHKFTNDIILYPINDKLYISFENNFISFDIFVKELNSTKPIITNNISIEGYIDNYIYIINLKNGKISKKIYSNNTHDILLKNSEIILKKVNYILCKKEKNTNKNLMNISYSDINIELKNRNNYFEKVNNINMYVMHDIINYFKINLEIGKIITIHSYNYNKRKLTLIYDKNIIEKNINNNKILNQNKDYNNYKNALNEKTNYIINKLDDLILKIASLRLPYIFSYFIFIIVIVIIIKLVPNNFIINFNNTNIINENYNYKFTPDFNHNKNTTTTDNNINNEIVIYNKNGTDTENITNEILDKNKKTNKNNNKKICNKINNFSIISNSDTDKSKENSLNKKKSSIILLNNNDYNNFSCSKNKNSITRCASSSELVKKCDFENLLNENLEEKNLDSDNINSINPEIKKKFPDFFDFYNKYHKYCNLLNNKKINITECRKYDDFNCLISLNVDKDNSINCLVPINELSKFLNKFKLMPNINKKTLLLPGNKLINKKNKEENNSYNNSIQSIKEDSKKSVEKFGGIWDDDDDEDDIDENTFNDNKSKKEEEKISYKILIENNNNDENISEFENNISKKINKKSNNESKINTNSYTNKNIDNKKNKNKTEIMNKSRLDKDFKNLEKIGQGGFGVVLKGEHRLDKGVCAIKIIKLKDINDKDSIINEAITMTKLTSKHIVQYKTCWIDNNLGSATKFFYDEDDMEPESLSLSVSKSNVFPKKNIIINDESEDNDDENEDNNDENNDLNLSKKNSNISRNIKKKNDSQELEKNKNKLSKYYCNYRDDSHIGTKSIISNRYRNESLVESEGVLNGEYFFILMEYCDGLTLDKYISQYIGKSIERKTIYNFISQILKSLVKIHSSGIIHRDIKPCNIFIKNDQIKIGDFGLATRYPNTGKLLKSKKIEGTPLYLSPEQKNFKTYNEKVDIYACGITLYEMCSCFSTSMERYDDIMKLKNHNIISEKIIKNYPEESTLIKLMTKSDFNERPSAKDILESESFINLGKSLGY